MPDSGQRKTLFPFNHTMITTRNLTKYFSDFLAVDDINLDVESGHVLALLGPNGAGKTTTVRMLTSVLRPSQGWAKVAGYDVVTEAIHVRSSVGVLTEHHGLYNRMPAEDYLDFFGQIYNLDSIKRHQRVWELLENFGLENVSRKALGEFSKGMRQKLALARALLHEPPVLLLDEPTSAMDPESAHLVRAAIRKLRSAERTIIICTHNLAEAEELADQIAIIRLGRVIAQGSPQALKAELLGPAEFELRFTDAAIGADNGYPEFPEDSFLTSSGPGWLRFTTPEPEKHNPVILQNLIQHGTAIISLQEVPRSLEQVYLQAINTPQHHNEGQDVR